MSERARIVTPSTTRASSGRSATTGTSWIPSCRTLVCGGLPARGSASGPTRSSASSVRSSADAIARERRHRRRQPAAPRALRPLGERGRRDRAPPGDARLEARDVGVRIRLRASRADAADAWSHDAGRGDRGRALPRVPGRHRARLQHRDDEWRRRTGRRVRAARRARRRSSPGCAPNDLDSGIDGSMFLTEREGGSDLGNTVHCVARDLGDGRVADRRREVVLLERRRRGDRAPRPSGGRGRRVGRPRPVPRSRTSRRRRAQPLHDPPAQGQARHEERADRRGRVPRRGRLRARARSTARHRAPTRAGSTA